MNKRSSTLLGAVTLAVTMSSAVALAGEIANYSPVTQQRLNNPEPGNWLLYRRTYDGHAYSPLDKINTSNVSKLTPVWTFSTGVGEGHQAPLLVNNGVAFVTTPQNQVLAMNAKTGELIWRYKKQLPEDLFQLHPTNRGVGMWQDKLFLATVDAHLVAIDAKTGKQLWDSTVEDYKKGHYLTLMPLVVNGKVIVGGSGGEYGIRGYIAAYDADTGKQLWRTYTVPGPGEPGSETWQGDDWKSGGGSAWITGNYDPELNLIYWGTGNAAPWPGDAHPGDNLYTTSVVAIDPETGKFKNHFQYHGNDSWDWDEIDPPVLIDMERNGKKIKTLVHPGRDAIFWVLERKADSIDFVDGWKYVYTNVWTNIDKTSGKLTRDPEFTPVVGKKVEFAPSLWGGKDWLSTAYNEKTKLLYVPANENLTQSFKGEKVELTPGQLWLGTKVEDIKLGVRKGWDHIGELQAWDPATGKKAWQYNFPKSQLFGSVLTTGGGLVFVGGTNDRKLRALDAKSGKVLWEFVTNSGITAAPVSFEVDGTQYIAVQSGWGVDAQRIQDGLSALNIGFTPDVPQGGVVWVFAVK